MAEHVQKQKVAQTGRQVPECETEHPPAADLTETDALLDEIDEALSGLADDLASTFRQKGGQAVAVAWDWLRWYLPQTRVRLRWGGKAPAFA